MKDYFAGFEPMIVYLRHSRWPYSGK